MDIILKILNDKLTNMLEDIHDKQIEMSMLLSGYNIQYGDGVYHIDFIKAYDGLIKNCNDDEFKNKLRSLKTKYNELDRYEKIIRDFKCALITFTESMNIKIF